MSQGGLVLTYFMLMAHGSLHQASLANDSVLGIWQEVLFEERTTSIIQLKRVWKHTDLEQLIDEETEVQKEKMTFPTPCGKTKTWWAVA